MNRDNCAVQHLHACHVRMIFHKILVRRGETFAQRPPYTWMLAHGRFFLATPGEFPGCTKVQSGFLFIEPDAIFRTAKFIKTVGIYS
ncbi:hypothetical protein [Mesorhizobium sp. ES1-4]|uniref:hypothetical protein n=1 Tax=Mesorhizobium sp. ES1-4 TaxID=2876627 RepID=UPI001CCB6740|nr:hypothetical protein [Mesorhizobium sp. ES1-4]MBZ9798292.1 hypothetical protein [Mesorhizobium sp. ES1-4]